MKQFKSFFIVFAVALSLAFTFSGINGSLSEASEEFLIDIGPAPPREPDPVPFVPSLPDEFVPGEVLVKFKYLVSPDNPGLSTLKSQFSARLERTHELIGVHLFKLEDVKDKEETLKAVEEFQKHELVEFSEPNGIVRALYTTNDPYLGDQWGLSRINAFAAWDLARGDPAGRIAILDTGIDYYHPEFNVPGKVNDNPSCINGLPTSFDDDWWNGGHGTHVAGIAAAQGDNGIGIAGVAFNAGLKALKVLDWSSWGTYDTVACGINMAAADPQVKVINLSLGWDAGSSTLYNAIYNAWVNNGKTVVAANGNSGYQSPYMYPACYSLNGIVIAVGATDFYNTWPSYSSANNCTTIAAPGGSWSTNPPVPNPRIFSTLKTDSGTYGYMHGTSMAAPHVSGVVALMQQYRPRTPFEIKRALINTTTDLGTPGWDIYFGAGLVDAFRAVCELPFNDVYCGHWAQYYINAVYYNGITNGCSANPRNYCPDMVAARNQMAVFIIKGKGETPSQAPYNAYFDDIPNDGYAPYINRMYELGITLGCGTRQYCPTSATLRDQMAAFIIRAKLGEVFTYPSNPYFTDVPQTHWAFKYVQKLRELGITTGCTPSLYCPDNSLIRSEMAAFIARGFLGML